MTVVFKSPVNRFGGKFYLRDFLVQYIPQHTCYIEPFCGAGHLLFSKTLSQVEVINDIDGHLIAFFQVIKDHEKRQKLIEILEYMPYSRKLWQDIRTQWKAGNIPEDEIERSAQWFYLNRTTFAGDQKRGGFAIPSTTGRNPVQSFRNAVDSLKAIAERLRNVCIENLPYQECIKRYDSPETLFYCDPPYLSHEGYYAKDAFTEQDHYRLANILHSVKAKVMLSHYECGLYDQLYKGWQRYEYSSFKGSHKSEGGGKPKTVECLYTNFEPVKTKGLFDENILV